MPLLKVCLNGARAPGDHPALPLSPRELADAAWAAVDAGAQAIHMHPRGAAGHQSLAAADVGAALLAVHAACPGVPVGVSTLFSILPDVEARRAAVASWRELPDFASVNFSEPGAGELCAALADLGVAVEAGIDSAAAAEAYVRWGLAGACLRVLIEPGEPTLHGAMATIAQIEAALDYAADRTPRLLHGQDATAWPVLDLALARGYSTRIGLEDVLDLPGGALAQDNAALIAEARRRASAAGHA
ncbi:hypothetical protein F8S13_19840 [Chloroflexia bacterium SDU3-3]|nr:hypothetical protein F8S13_19840 [Chloroflexia bacterium SDU3-3]